MADWLHQILEERGHVFLTDNFGCTLFYLDPEGQPMVQVEGRVPGGGGYPYIDFGKRPPYDFEIRDLERHLEGG